MTAMQRLGILRSGQLWIGILLHAAVSSSLSLSLCLANCDRVTHSRTRHFPIPQGVEQNAVMVNVIGLVLATGKGKFLHGS